MGTSAATLRFSQDGSSALDTTAAAATRPAISATPDRPQERAARSEQRITAAPETSPSSSPSPSPSPKPPKTSSPPPNPPSGGGSVVSSATCQASFYTDQGSRTANGETFNVNDFTAAHKTLPFNTRVRVTNINNGKSVVVRINDRGPFVAGRCLDLTPAAFNTIANQSAGVATVKYEVLSS